MPLIEAWAQDPHIHARFRCDDTNSIGLVLVVYGLVPSLLASTLVSTTFHYLEGCPYKHPKEKKSSF
jgi:hypothetical protein